MSTMSNIRTIVAVVVRFLFLYSLFLFALNHLSLGRIQLHKLLSKRDFFKLGFLTKDADRTL